MGGLSKGPRLGAQACFESLGLAQPVRPTAQPLLEPAIHLVAIAHQPADKPVAKDVLQDFLAAVANEVQADRRRDEHPQPQQLAPFLPRCFIGMGQDFLLQFFDQLFFNRLDRPTGFVDTLVDCAGGERDAQPVSQKFLRPPTRQVHAVGETHQQADQHRPDEMPFAQADAPPGLGSAAAGLAAIDMPTLATGNFPVEMFVMAYPQAGELRIPVGIEIQDIPPAMRDKPGRIQRLTAAHAGFRSMDHRVVDRQGHLPAMACGPGRSPRFLGRAGRRAARRVCLRRCGKALRLGIATSPASHLSALPVTPSASAHPVAEDQSRSGTLIGSTGYDHTLTAAIRYPDRPALASAVLNGSTPRQPAG
ncbi:MAG: hypothetical protein AW09_003765 [Candidatus Accumulibacter phosphatis]|uniref:Uncharacterized protein n=1 Tax=Candidatus Accumulibacter phosphatis TaxID=327160 RepID=A0A080LS44_9PROT|nr:MAG: hypothetical protein AW09_003765 [Candidatus Accumulibacter phosphatis]